MFLEKPGRKLYFGLWAQAEQGPGDYRDRVQDPEITPLCPSTLYEADGQSLIQGQTSTRSPEKGGS